MSNPLPSMPPGQPVAVPVESSGLLDRISAWVSENKAVVYTIAGVAVVVTGAGAVYYLSDTVRPAMHPLCSCPAGRLWLRPPGDLKLILINV